MKYYKILDPYNKKRLLLKQDDIVTEFDVSIDYKIKPYIPKQLLEKEQDGCNNNNRKD